MLIKFDNPTHLDSDCDGLLVGFDVDQVEDTVFTM